MYILLKSMQKLVVLLDSKEAARSKEKIAAAK